VLEVLEVYCLKNLRQSRPFQQQVLLTFQERKLSQEQNFLAEEVSGSPTLEELFLTIRSFKKFSLQKLSTR
jgi:hypothetical protein